MGFPIRKSPDHRLCTTYPKLIADYHVLLRLMKPRHPPCALTLFTLVKNIVANKNAYDFYYYYFALLEFCLCQYYKANSHTSAEVIQVLLGICFPLYYDECFSHDLSISAPHLTTQITYIFQILFLCPQCNLLLE